MESPWHEKASQCTALFCEQDEVFPDTHRAPVETHTFKFLTVGTSVTIASHSDTRIWVRVRSYDFSPFPYWPIWVDPGDLLFDFPNWMTCVASSNKKNMFNIYLRDTRYRTTENTFKHEWNISYVSDNKVALTGVHSYTIIKKTEHVAAPQLWPFLCKKGEKVTDMSGAMNKSACCSVWNWLCYTEAYLCRCLSV